MDQSVKASAPDSLILRINPLLRAYAAKKVWRRVNYAEKQDNLWANNHLLVNCRLFKVSTNPIGFSMETRQYEIVMV